MRRQSHSMQSRFYFQRAATCSGMLTLCVGLALTPEPTRGQVAVVDSFSEIPGAVFYNIVNSSPCGVHYRDSTDIDIAGRTVTVSYYSETSSDHRYPIGCTNWSSPSFDTWRIAPDQSVDPGDFIGDFNSGSGGDLILNFSEPLTGFGTTSILGLFASSSDPDRIIVYDAPNGAGSVLADVTTDNVVNLVLRLDFKGVTASSPVIRSVRYVNVSPGFSIDGFAVAVGDPCVAATVGTQPGALTTCDRVGAFSITTSGAAPISTQWRVESPVGGGVYVDLTAPVFIEAATGLSFDVSGATTESIAVSNIVLGAHPNLLRFVATVSNSCGNATSDPAPLTVRTPVPPDLDFDCDVDTDDFVLFQSCVSGPAILLTSGCENRDFDHDGVVDQADFGFFQRCYRGSNVPAEPNCAEP